MVEKSSIFRISKWCPWKIVSSEPLFHWRWLPVNFGKFLSTRFLSNTYERLILIIQSSYSKYGTIYCTTLFISFKWFFFQDNIKFQVTGSFSRILSRAYLWGKILSLKKLRHPLQFIRHAFTSLCPKKETLQLSTLE